LFRADDIVNNIAQLARKEEERDAAELARKEEEEDARNAYNLSIYVAKRGPKQTSETTPKNARRREQKEEKKMYDDWKCTTPDMVGWREKFNEILDTKYGHMKCRRRLTPDTPDTPNVKVLNEKIVDGLRRFIPEVGKLQNTYMTSKICVDEKKVRVPGQKPNIDGPMTAVLGVNPQTIRQGIRRRKVETAGRGAGSGTEDKTKKLSKAEISIRKQYPPKVQKKQWNDHEQRGHQAFFERISHILSGTGVDSNRRHIAMPQHEVKMELYAETPQILCQIFDEVPLITEQRTGKDHFTRFQASMLAAVHQRDQPGFDADENYRRRKKDAQEAHTLVLQKLQRYRSSKSTMVRARAISSINAITTEDPNALMATLSISNADEHIANDESNRD
jgi:hypothetical protein